MSDFLFEHLPFVAVMSAVAFLGYIIRLKRWWIEAVMLVSGAALIGLVWVDPEGVGYDRITSVAYFVVAGIFGLPAIAVARGFGYKIKITNDSENP